MNQLCQVVKIMLRCNQIVLIIKCFMNKKQLITNEKHNLLAKEILQNMHLDHQLFDSMALLKACHKLLKEKKIRNKML